jgi:hypothetical protein
LVDHIDNITSSERQFLPRLRIIVGNGLNLKQDGTTKRMSRPGLILLGILESQIERLDELLNLRVRMVRLFQCVPGTSPLNQRMAK